jgi:D-beta-D-heptose 7-phosphate kinase/D-beta-D-heptose 1-phosphate adenosyltransferase
MTLINEDGASHFPTNNVDVYDVSGAGDTAMAVLVYMISYGKPLHEAIKAANLASSYVVTKPMTYAISKYELDNLLSK